MLQSMREKMAGPAAWVVIGIIAVPFAFFGLDQFAGGGADPTLVRVGDQKIKQSQFRAAYDQQYQMLLRNPQFEPETLDRAVFREEVLQQMVRQSTLSQYTERNGYRTSDAALLNYLQSFPAFQEDGRFSRNAYRTALARQGISSDYYEAQQGRFLAIEQLADAIVDSAFVTDADRRLTARLIGQSRRFDYVRVPASRHLATVEAGVDEARAIYDAQPERFQTIERIRLAYVDLDLDSLMAARDPSEEVLRAIYDAEREARFSRPETRRGRHILLTGDDARARAEALAAQLAEGADFAELAREHSSDSLSAADGGDLGWVERDQLAPELEKALFALEEGQVSAPVQSNFGWHLVKLDELRADRTLAFDDASVQADLRRLYRARESELRFRELADKLEQAAFENPSSLDAAAEAVDQAVQSTGWLTRDAQGGLFAFDQVRRAAFSREVLAGENSGLISLGNSRVVVIRALEHEPVRQRDFEEVRESILGELRETRAAEKARQQAEAMVAALRDGGDIAELAAQNGLRVESHGPVIRDDESIDRVVRRAVFSLPRPEADAPSIGSVDLGAAGTAVVVLRSVEETDVPPDADSLLFSGLRELRAGAEFGSFIAQVEQSIRVRRLEQPEAESFEDFLDQGF